METVKTRVLECGVAVTPIPGEPEPGDRHLVKSWPDGVLVAVVDGLGHGPGAAEAAKIAMRTIEEHASEPVISLVKWCHASLLGTRGVVMSLASFNAVRGTLTWIGIGNVEGLVVRSDGATVPQRETLLLRGGVVGSRLPGLRASVLPLIPGDTLIFATDGIANDFARGINLDAPPGEVATRIMEQYSKSTDDALVLVARYLGYSP
ncbi:MAG: SpoIIE family protein phosphatase [Terriglobia bacterium]